MKVCILLSVYNGRKYLGEFIGSLLNQSYRDFVIYLRDDGSADGALEEINSLCGDLGERLIIVNDQQGNVGPCKSFLSLLSLAEGDYFLFADQDDIWLKYKIEVTLRKMLELEAIYGRRTPVLVHTDLVVVDENLRVVADSFWKYQGLNPEKRKLNYLLVQNNVTGCTVMVNRALKDLVHTLPERALMHDWWLALIASAFGIIDYISCPTVLYRQHPAQNTGARNYSLFSSVPYFFRNREKILRTLARTFDQAEEFYTLYESKLSDESKICLSNYLKLKSSRFMEKFFILYRNNFFKHGLLRNIGFLTCVLFKKY